MSNSRCPVNGRAASCLLVMILHASTRIGHCCNQVACSPRHTMITRNLPIPKLNADGTLAEDAGPLASQVRRRIQCWDCGVADDETIAARTHKRRACVGVRTHFVTLVPGSSFGDVLIKILSAVSCCETYTEGKTEMPFHCRVCPLIEQGVVSHELPIASVLHGVAMSISDTEEAIVSAYVAITARRAFIVGCM